MCAITTTLGRREHECFGDTGALLAFWPQCPPNLPWSACVAHKRFVDDCLTVSYHFCGACLVDLLGAIYCNEVDWEVQSIAGSGDCIEWLRVRLELGDDSWRWLPRLRDVEWALHLCNEPTRQPLPPWLGESALDRRALRGRVNGVTALWLSSCFDDAALTEACHLEALTWLRLRYPHRILRRFWRTCNNPVIATRMRMVSLVLQAQALIVQCASN